jgi:hypothetical protein
MSGVTLQHGRLKHRAIVTCPAVRSAGPGRIDFIRRAPKTNKKFPLADLIQRRKPVIVRRFTDDKWFAYFNADLLVAKRLLRAAFVYRGVAYLVFIYSH